MLIRPNVDFGNINYFTISQCLIHLSITINV